MSEPRQVDALRDVDGLRVLVVGAASGIGEAVAALAERRGAVVARADRAPGSGDGVRDMIVADIAVPDDCERTVAEAVARLGGLDALVVTAGTGHYATIEASDPQLWQRLLAVNLVGPALLTRAALPELRASSYASITTFASAAGLRTYPEFGVYAAAKAGLVQWTKVAAWELAGDRIRVNCISPGPIDTPLLRATQPAATSVEAWLTKVATHTAMGRAGTAAEVAEATLFMIGRRSSYMTGAVLPLDGGEIA